MILNIDHIGIAVKDLQKTIRVLESLGLNVAESGKVEPVKIEVAFFDVGETRIELVSPLVEDHELARHIRDQGEGLHHIAFNVRDIGEATENLEKSGIRIASDMPRGKGHGGKEFVFLDPKDTSGILIELYQAIWM